ncbi:hypothetical protein MWK40_00020 [Escherichia coli]|nr:hypothetical protein [Escherichia coli]
MESVGKSARWFRHASAAGDEKDITTKAKTTTGIGIGAADTCRRPDAQDSPQTKAAQRLVETANER